MPSIKDIIVREPTAQEGIECRKWPIWQKNTCTFDWEYSEKETCLLIEGKVTISDSVGSISFGQGDLVIFPQDLECTWHIKKPVKKYYNFGEIR